MSLAGTLRKGLLSIVFASTKPTAADDEEEGAPRDDVPPRTPRRQARSGRIPKLRCARILVIDDDATLANAIKRQLRHHDIHIALSGEDALAAIRGTSFEIVVSDVMMPRPAGLDVYRTLRDEGSPLAERFIFMTGGGHDLEARQFLRDVPNLCLPKPLDFDTLELAICALLRGEDPHGSSCAG